MYVMTVDIKVLLVQNITSETSPYAIQFYTSWIRSDIHLSLCHFISYLPCGSW